jgi:acetoin utilization deacetylase AcuC-like enzyme
VPTAYITHPSFLLHDMGPFHPECPDRLRAIADRLISSGIDAYLRHYPAPEATGEQLARVHSAHYVATIEAESPASGLHFLDPDTAMNEHSLTAARHAAGALVLATDLVLRGECRTAFCAVRPPGHHAERNRAMGFCLFNNVAVAAAWLLQTRRAERVAILDYDVHHGNGTQDAFYRRSDVLYISTHQYPLYPGTGRWQELGADAGRGYTLNVAVPPGSGDAVFAAAREQLVEPLVRRYQPDFLIVSLGFDAFWRDPLAQLQLSIGGAYTPLLQSACALARELCGGRLVVALEGGYELDALAVGSDAACRLLLGLTVADDPIGPSPDELPLSAVQPLITGLRQLHGLC